MEFIDLNGCVTEGNTLEDAKVMAKEALTGWLKTAYDLYIDIPEPSNTTGKDIYYISPEPEIEIPMTILKLRTEKGLSQKQVAEAIGIKYQTYQRFENPKTFNATVKNLKRISSVLGKSLEIQLR